MKTSARVIGLLLLPGVLLTGCQKAEEPSQQAGQLAIPELVPLPLVGPGIHQQTVTMPPDTTIHYTLSIPLGHDGSKPRPLIVALHDANEGTPFYGRGTIDSLVKPAFDQLGPIAVAPDVLGGGDWTALPNELAVVWLSRCVQKSYAIDPKKVLLTGFGMGGQGTWLIAGRHRDLFTAAIPIAGPPAGGDAHWNIPVYVIHSEIDEVVPLAPTQQHVEALRAKGARVEMRVISGVSHYQTGKFAGPLRETVPWLKRAWGEP